jgi:hypothetical protein
VYLLGQNVDVDGVASDDFNTTILPATTVIQLRDQLSKLK